MNGFLLGGAFVKIQLLRGIFYDLHNRFVNRHKSLEFTTQKKTNLTIHHLEMYFLLKMDDFPMSCYMLVFRGVVGDLRFLLPYGFTTVDGRNPTNQLM